MEASGDCMRAVMRMSMCPVCQGLGEVKPCGHYCLNVFKGCLAYHADLGVEWDNYVGTFSTGLKTTLMPVSFDFLDRTARSLFFFFSFFFFDFSILHLFVCAMQMLWWKWPIDFWDLSTSNWLSIRSISKSLTPLWISRRTATRFLKRYTHIFRLCYLYFSDPPFFNSFQSLLLMHFHSHKWWFVARCGSLRLSAKLLFEYLFFFGCRKEGMRDKKDDSAFHNRLWLFSPREIQKTRGKKAKWMRTAYFWAKIEKSWQLPLGDIVVLMTSGNKKMEKETASCLSSV